jgi:DNA modification methylase
MTSSNKRGTKTSAFGSPGKISHDATRFYSSKLYQGVVDHIYCSSAEKMGDLPDNSVHLMVTSPPYNVGKEYDEDLTLKEYLSFLKQVWAEVYRVLTPGGRACVNVANLGRKPYIPLHAFIIEDMIDLGFLMRGEVIWDKGASAAASTAWGSWQSASNPTLRDVHEYILVFSKDAFRRLNPHKRVNTITKDQFLEFTKSVWSFGAESARKVGHPAPFPVELPYRLIQLYTYEGDVVLDPFMGSGQTAIAAIKSGRHYVGYEIDEKYTKLAEKRVREFKAS